MAGWQVGWLLFFFLLLFSLYLDFRGGQLYPVPTSNIKHQTSSIEAFKHLLINSFIVQGVSDCFACLFALVYSSVCWKFCLSSD
ncbi:hypothetical protein BP00DRAFT_426115, partial [Aspergillus indologenus CBS 114.80]